MIKNFYGRNFLGKLHNTKQHIQFLQWIRDEIELPLPILASFLTSYSNLPPSWGMIEDRSMLPTKKQTIKNTECDVYIFEICSRKVYERDGYQVQYELTEDYVFRTQTAEEIWDDLVALRKMIPGKRIIFQTHFRLEKIEAREVLHDIVKRFCATVENTYHYDPTVILTPERMYDQTHFSDAGHSVNFDYLYEHFISPSHIPNLHG